MFRRALALAEARGGALEAAVLHNLAVNVEDQGRLEDAGALYERALAAREALAGAGAAALRPTLVRLARVREAAGRFEEALALYDRAIPLAEAELGEAHQVTSALRGFREEAARRAGEAKRPRA